MRGIDPSDVTFSASERGRNGTERLALVIEGDGEAGLGGSEFGSDWPTPE